MRVKVRVRVRERERVGVRVRAYVDADGNLAAASSDGKRSSVPMEVPRRGSRVAAWV